MNPKVILFLLVAFYCRGFAQTFEYERSFGAFENATSFYINSAGIVFVTDDVTDEVYELDTLGNEIESIGGYGWQTSTFDDPVDVFADPLKVLVTDKNNNRIQQFDKNLNFIFQFYKGDSDFDEERFGYPLSAAQSNLGDVFILDSENKRILKFDLFGNFIQTIGGYDYGAFTLLDPKKLAVSMQNNIYVLDGNDIYIYDNYGNPVGNLEVPEKVRSIRIIFQWLTLNSDSMIYASNLTTKEKILYPLILNGLDEEIRFVSSLIFNGKLYVLTPKNILIFSQQ